MELKSIGKNIRKIRLEKGIKQEKLAELTNLSANYIRMLERADKILSLPTFIRIINAFDVSVGEILSGVLNNRYEIHGSLVFDKISKLGRLLRWCDTIIPVRSITSAGDIFCTQANVNKQCVKLFKRAPKKTYNSFLFHFIYRLSNIC